MIPLAFGVAIFDEPTRLARLEADGTPLLLAGLLSEYCLFLLHTSLLWFGGTSSSREETVVSR
jgi:hypothetical protein